MFEVIIRAFVTAEIRFVVIGGVAAVVQGSARFTNDIDICYDDTAPNPGRLASLLASWHAYLRGVERGLPFVMDERALLTTPIMTLSTDKGDVDIMDRVAGLGDYRAVLREAEYAKIGAVRFRTLTLDGLIKAKRAAGRKRDLEHLVELEALRALRNERGR
jgi:predicted nucleotidyltransferase